MAISLAHLKDELTDGSPLKSYGRVTGVRGPVVYAKVPQAAIGDLCYITLRDQSLLPAQVVSFSEDSVCLAPFDDPTGLSPGAMVHTTGATPRIPRAATTPGQVLDPLGFPLSLARKTHSPSDSAIAIGQSPPNPLSRGQISTLLPTGVAAIDGMCSLGYGQRIGLFASAGVGKSTLLGMISRNASVDLSVIALVGERGREVNDFINDSLGPEGLKRAIVVVATSDESPIRRMLAAKTATAIAEHHRDQGKRVLLLVDSLTRVARAVREVGLSAGEVPVRQGYTASVYTELPKLLERAGTARVGSITGIYTVLTARDSDNDPLGDEIKSILDGHIVLDPQLAQQGIRPAIDLTTSISRLLPALHQREHLETIQTVQRILARIRKDKELLLFGGTPDPELRAAIEVERDLKSILCQSPHQSISVDVTVLALRKTTERFQSLVDEYCDALRG